eukprot:6198276-Pleurochrysis_carterae.AAC.2
MPVDLGDVERCRLGPAAPSQNSRSVNRRSRKEITASQQRCRHRIAWIWTAHHEPVARLQTDQTRRMADVAAIGDALTVAAAAEQRAKSEDCAGMEDIAVLSKLLEEMAPPPAMGLEAPLDEKYAFITANKGTGNNEFKAKRYASAIKIYIDAVEALSRECYPSRERMMWDYAARELVAQCYSNAAASALKLAQQKGILIFLESASKLRAARDVDACIVTFCGSTHQHGCKELKCMNARAWKGCTNQGF